jgi:hypothetical protein
MVAKQHNVEALVANGPKIENGCKPTKGLSTRYKQAQDGCNECNIATNQQKS